MKGFWELLCWVSTKALGNKRYLTNNTRSNRVVIISSVITRIVFNSVQFWMVTFKPFSKKTLMIYLCCTQCSCASYIVQYFITVVRFLFVLCSTFVSFNSCSILLLQYSLFKEKDSILILDCIPGILIQLYKKYPFKQYVKYLLYHHHLCKSINIIHQTTPPLSQYGSEWPITIIDIAGYTEPIFSKS